MLTLSTAFMVLLPILPIDSDRNRCTERLQAISRAIETYRHDQGKLPDHLSSLVPRHFPSMAALHCPADRSAGSPGNEEGHADPTGLVSYSYEMRLIESGGLSSPPGPAPMSDIPGKSWGSERNVMLWLKRFYGNWVPVVRCYHHKTPAGPRVLNLTLEGAVYEGSIEWKNDPDSVTEILLRAGRDLAGDPRHFDREWKLFALDDYAQGWEKAAASARTKAAMHAMAESLVNTAVRLNDPATAYRLAARLWLHVGEFARAEDTARKVLSRSDQAENENARQLLAEALRGQGRHTEAARVLRSMLAKNPESRNIRLQLAETLTATGEHREADDLIARFDPGRRLVGKLAPDFHVPLLDGSQTDVALALRGKKVLLVNFWFHRCGPCREEFPRLQALYDALKDKGLAVIAVDSDDGRATIARYVSASGWTFPVALGSQTRDGFEIPKAYCVDTFPTNFLIDAQRKIVFRCIGWDEPGLLAALAKLGVK